MMEDLRRTTPPQRSFMSEGLEGFGAVPVKNIPGLADPCSPGDTPPSPELTCVHTGGGKHYWAPPKLPCDLSKLNPHFEPIARRLIARIKETGLPLVAHDCRRTPERQLWAKKIGGSKVGPDEGAHVHGFAIDFRLTPEYVAKHNLRWDGDHGLNYTGDTRTKIVKPAAYGIWAAFGSLIKEEFPELRWGGNFGKTGNKIFGWDVYHVELWNPKYTSLIKQGQGWDILPSLDTAVKVGVPIAAIVGGGLAYWFLFRKKRRR